MSARKKQRKATGMVMEEVNENFREGQDDEAKINIVVGMPKIDSLSSASLLDESSPVRQNQIPLDPVQQSAPQPEVLHSGRISLRRGVEQKVIEDSVNNSLSPMKSRTMKDKDVYERLYSDHQEKLINENLTKSAAAGEFIGSNSPQKNNRISASSSPKPPRVYSIGPDLIKKKEEAAENYIKERRKEGHPQINEVSRQLAERIEPTDDRKAFNAQLTIKPALRKDLTLEERTQAELEKNHYSFHPQITTLDPAILASPGTSTSATSPSSTPAAPAAATSASSSSISTPQRGSKQGLTISSPTSTANLPAAGSGEGGAGANGQDAVPVHDRLKQKGLDMEARREERRKRYAAEDCRECRDPHVDPHSARLIPEGSTFMKRYQEWIGIHQNANKANGEGGATLGAGDLSGGNTERIRASSVDGADTLGRVGSRQHWGDRGSWIGNATIWGTSREDEEMKECTHTPNILRGHPHPSEELQEWIEKTYGVKKFLERSELARRLKDEKPLFHAERKYPPPPTKFREFNLTKTKKELEKEGDESFET